MGILFLDGMIYSRSPNLWIEAARAGVLPVVIAALLSSSVDRASSGDHPSSVGRPVWTTEHPVLPDPPHVHGESEDPRPPTSYLAAPGASGGTPNRDRMSWQNNSSDVAARVIRGKYHALQEAHTRVASMPWATSAIS